MKQLIYFGILFLILSACSNPENTSDTDSSNEKLSSFEFEHGIGPISDTVELDVFNPELARQGRQLFSAKCLSCHSKDTRLLGPAYGSWLQERSVEFIMNFTMNPVENIRNHPIGKALHVEYMIEMPNQNISRDEARSIIEYLRSYHQ